jgi:hypothetical protein
MNNFYILYFCQQLYSAENSFNNFDLQLQYYGLKYIYNIYTQRQSRFSIIKRSAKTILEANYFMWTFYFH